MSRDHYLGFGYSHMCHDEGKQKKPLDIIIEDWYMRCHLYAT